MTVLTNYLRRYTNIPALLHMLREQKLTLLDPQTWDDKNDSHYLSVYRDKRQVKCVLALCFAQVTETYHHWRVFADGSSGVCVSFHRGKLLAALHRQKGVTTRDVEYVRIDKLAKRKVKIEELPFLKRAPYGDEREFRVIFESKTETLNALNIPIPLACIDRVILSPWLSKALQDHLKNTIHEIKGCKSLKITATSLISNERWKSFAEQAR